MTECNNCERLRKKISDLEKIILYNDKLIQELKEILSLRPTKNEEKEE